MTDHAWPSREEWAKDRRTPYWDRTEGIEVSKKASDYVDAEAISAMITSLKEEWRRLGKLLRASTDEAERIRLKDERHAINVCAHMLEGGKVPALHGLGYKTAANGITAPIREAYDAAMDAAYAERVKEIEATPIDDAAWGRELQRRIDVDAYLGRRSR